MSQLYGDGTSVGPDTNGISSHCASVEIVRMEVVESDLHGGGGPGSKDSVGVQFSHTDHVVLNGSISVLKGWGVPSECDGSGGPGCRQLLWCSSRG